MSDTMTRTAMVALMRRAMAGPAQLDAIDPEHLALLAEGRADELGKADRQRLLSQIAQDADARRWLAELTGPARSATARRARRTVRPLAVAWALAASLTVALGLWSWTVPPRPADAPAHGIEPYSVQHDGADYWDQLDRQRLVEQAQGRHWRDYAWLISASASLLLSVALLIALLGRRSRREPLQEER